MGRSVTVKPGVDDLNLPDGRTYRGGDTVHLTDAQWALVDPALLHSLVDNGSEADPVESPGGSSPDSWLTSYLSSWTGGDAVVWDSTATNVVGSDLSLDGTDHSVVNVATAGRYVVSLALQITSDVADELRVTFGGTAIGGPGGYWGDLTDQVGCSAPVSGQRLLTLPPARLGVGALTVAIAAVNGHSVAFDTTSTLYIVKN